MLAEGLNRRMDYQDPPRLENEGVSEKVGLEQGHNQKTLPLAISKLAHHAHISFDINRSCCERSSGLLVNAPGINPENLDSVVISSRTSGFEGCIDFYPKTFLDKC
jgi:hypothetical protein